MTDPAPPISVVILAGGRGTRLKGMFPDLPKPLIPVSGQPFLFWLTRFLAAQGLPRFIYATGYQGDKIATWAADASMPGLDRQCRRETQPLGTGGALLHCLDLCAEWVLVANGDGLVMDGVAALLALRDRPTLAGGLLAVSVPDTARYGSLVLDGEDRVLGFREKVPGAGWINGGLYLFRRALLEAHRRDGFVSLEADLFPEFLRAGAELRAIRLPSAPFIDIGTPETMAQAEAFVRDHVI